MTPPPDPSASGDRPLRLLVVDDHAVVRAGLVALLSGEPDLEVVAEAGTVDEAVRQAAAHRPDAVLMDLQLSTGGDGPDGADAAARILAAPNPPAVLMLTTYDADADVLRAVEAGAAGYLLKACPPEELFDAVRTVARGGSAISPQVAGRVMQRMRPDSDALSSREIEVLTLLARGLSNRAIARELFVSEATVKTHLVHVYTKLGVETRTAAVAEALSRRLIRRP